jgi:hypothetical protein
MSNLSIFKNGGGVPAHLQKRELSAATKALMGGFENRRISIRGGVFRKVINGQEVGSIPERALNVVIVGVAEHTSRQFYKAAYQENADPVPPDCYSADGVTPASTATAIQAATCAACPQNIAGSGQGDSKACRFQRRIAVVLEKNLEDGEVYEMTLAATSLFGGKGKPDPDKMGMRQYANFLGGYGVNIDAVVTELRFDLDAATPKLLFAALRPLETDELILVEEYSKLPETIQAITYSFGGVIVKPPAAELPFLQPPAARPAAAPAPAPAPAPMPQEPELTATTTVPRTRVTRNRPAPAPAPEVIPEPVKRTAAPQPQPVSTDINQLLDEWGDE